MAKTFKKVVICHTNDFGSQKAEQIQRWVTTAGGRVLADFTDEVTHLIASKHAWKQYTPLVQMARRKRMKVVTLSWLEASLVSPARKPLDTSPFEWEKRKSNKLKRSAPEMLNEEATFGTDSTSKKHKTARIDLNTDAVGAETDKVCMELEKEMADAGYHVYEDETQAYAVTLLRHDTVRSRRKERHHLKLFETDNVPHAYACSTHYTRPGLRQDCDTITTLAPKGSSWNFAYQMFTKFFAQRTGVGWDARPKTMGEVMEKRRTMETDDAGVSMKFEYKLPKEKGKSFKKPTKDMSAP